MDVRIDETGTPSLHGADDFTSLRLSGVEPASAAAGATLAGCGVALADDRAHGFIDPSTFARLAGAHADRPEWQDGLRRMLEYAAGKGWTDDSGRIRAHAEWDR